MKTLCKKAGVKYFRFHALRHFGASVMDHANVPKGSIQRILGHERRETTEIYLHSIGESEREAIRIMEEALLPGQSTKCAHETEISKCAHECAHKKTGSLD
jgi:integrase